MIYIHALNQGLHYHTIDIATATAKDFNWHLKLTTEATSEDSSTTVLEMPQEMAIRLFWWYCKEEASDKMLCHISCLLDGVPKEHIVEQLEWSVTNLVNNRKRSYLCGRVITSAEADMALEIQDHLEGGYDDELYVLLDAKGFEKIVDVVA